MSPSAERFDREYGCTLQEWLRWMPDAVHGHPWTQAQQSRLEVVIGPGRLVLSWEVLAPRAIALIRLPRLQVHFEFQGVNPAAQAAFMKRFDLHLQRGGG